MFSVRSCVLSLPIFLAVASNGAGPVVLHARPQIARTHSRKASVQVLLTTVNDMRTKHHLKPFKFNAKLSRCATAHSVAMAKDGPSGALFHDLGHDLCIHFVSGGENIGYASGSPRDAVLTVYRSMMAEGPCPVSCPIGSVLWGQHGHYLNLTSRVFNVIGIGVHTRYYKSLGQSLTWVTEDFVQR